MPKHVTKSGKKYRIDGEFYIAEDESHVIYRDVKYNWFNNYYRRHHFSGDIPSNLQRAVWIDHFGPIPEDHHIHHVDGNRKNNHIENLQCLSRSIHQSLSAKKSQWIGSKGHLDHLDSVRDKTKTWHASQDGHEWHKKHAEKNKFGKHEPITRTCKQCKNEFQTKVNHQVFCSGKCKTKFRVLSGIDNENRKCKRCQKYFVINRYSRREYCGKNCPAKLKKSL